MTHGGVGSQAAVTLKRPSWCVRSPSQRQQVSPGLWLPYPSPLSSRAPGPSPPPRAAAPTGRHGSRVRRTGGRHSGGGATREGKSGCSPPASVLPERRDTPAARARRETPARGSPASLSAAAWLACERPSGGVVQEQQQGHSFAAPPAVGGLQHPLTSAQCGWRQCEALPTRASCGGPSQCHAGWPSLHAPLRAPSRGM